MSCASYSWTYLLTRAYFIWRCRQVIRIYRYCIPPPETEENDGHSILAFDELGMETDDEVRKVLPQALPSDGLKTRCQRNIELGASDLSTNPELGSMFKDLWQS